MPVTPNLRPHRKDPLVKPIAIRLLASALALTVAAAPAGCAQAKKDATVVKQDLVECAKQALGQTVVEAGASLLMTVIAIIATSGDNWQADLDALAAKYGADALACATKIASDLFKPAPTLTPTTGNMNDSPYARSQLALGKYSRGKILK